MWLEAFEVQSGLGLRLSKIQSTPTVGFMDCTKGAEVAFSPIGSSFTHYLCSGNLHPKMEIPTALIPVPKSYWRAVKNDFEGSTRAVVCPSPR